MRIKPNFKDIISVNKLALRDITENKPPKERQGG
jgi:hypothetical protein